MSDYKLLPCPFCGGKPYIQRRPTAQKKCIYSIQCRCGVLTHFMDRLYKAKGIWNTRAQLSRQQEE